MTPEEYYIIRWDSGYGDNYDVIKVEDHETALDYAYKAWKEEAENNSDYDAELATEEALDNIGFDPADYGFEEEEERGN